MITLGLVDSVDDNGVYVTMPGSRGVLRGPYKALDLVTEGQTVLLITTDDGEVVVGGSVGGGVGVSVKAFGARGDGVTDDTASIQAAIDAVHDLGGGTVVLPPGRFVVSGNGLEAKSVSIVGAGPKSFSESGTLSKGSTLVGADQTGPVLTLSGGTQSGMVGFYGTRLYEGFAIVGDGTSDEHGLLLDDAHLITLRNLVIRGTRGVPLAAYSSYFITVDDCVLGEPVNVYDNDTYYAALYGVNSWRTKGLMVRGYSSGSSDPTVGPSGAILVDSDGTSPAEQNDFQFVAEDLVVAEGSLGVVDHRGNQNRIEFVSWDCHNQPDEEFTTPWVGVKLSDPSAGVSLGANLVTGNLMGHYSASGWVQTTYGVWIEQDANAVVAVPGYPVKAVYIASGCNWNTVQLLGTRFKPSEAVVVDDSGGNGNVIIDGWQTKFVADKMSFFGYPVVEQPTVTGSRGGNAALASLLTALADLGLITDSTS